ncbi:unnamed protein product, partial [Medioppia subpectinata]
MKPVMVYIHGGGLTMGSSYAFNGKMLATYDVVVVSVNYRLGPLGWLFGDGDDAPGNMGLYDQLLALKWIRNNIHAFRGDYRRITLFGEGAGGWSVSAHILSPLARGYFHRAILSSGAYFDDKNLGFLNKSAALKQSQELGKQFKCVKGFFSNWIDCLKAINPIDISTYPQFFSYPVFGTEYLPYNAQYAIRKGRYNYGMSARERERERE